MKKGVKIMVLTEENAKEWGKALSQRMIEVFGKDSFTEDELTKDFYVDLMIKCGSFFEKENGVTDLDLFWADDLREWLLKPSPKEL